MHKRVVANCWRLQRICKWFKLNRQSSRPRKLGSYLKFAPNLLLFDSKISRILHQRFACYPIQTPQYQGLFDLKDFFQMAGRWCSLHYGSLRLDLEALPDADRPLWLQISTFLEACCTCNMVLCRTLGFSQGWEFFIFAQIFSADVLKVFMTVLYIFWNFH